MTSLGKRTALIVIAVIVILGGWYGVVAYRYWNNPPQLTRNFAAELNAPIEAVPLDQRAWPVYRDALLEIDRLPTEWSRPFFRPWLNADNAQVAQFVRGKEASLAKVRAASRLPSMGYLVSDGESKADARVRTRNADPHYRIAPHGARDNPILMNTLMTAPMEVGELVDLLAVDALLAAREQDFERMAEDLPAMIGIAEQVRNAPDWLADTLSAVYFSRGLRTWGLLMTSTPDAFDEARLRRLEDAARGFAGGKIGLRFDFSRAVFLDVMQRLYTDDGAGEGYFFAPAQHALDFAPEPLPRWKAKLAAPFTKQEYYGRKQSVEQFERWLQLTVADTARPLWRCTDWPHVEAHDKLRPDRRWGIVSLFAGPQNGAHQNLECVVQQRDAVLAASALLRYHLRHGDWPKTLRELVPEFLPAVPIDRLDGQPLSYKRAAGANPVIYSVGADLDDDGGRAALVVVNDDNLGRNESVRGPWHWDFTTHRYEKPDGDLILWPVVSTEELSHKPPNQADPHASAP